MRTADATCLAKVLLLLPGPLIAGLLTYLILSYLYTPIKISVPLSIIISTLIFGLNKYYLFLLSNKEETRNIQRQNHKASRKVYACLNLFFICISGIVILVLVTMSISERDDYVSFVPWQQMTTYDILKLAAAIAFSFFLPGYALLGIIDKSYRLSLTLRFLLSYLISILFVALTSYIVVSLGYFRFDVGLFMIALFVAIFVSFILKQLRTLNADFSYAVSILHIKPLSCTWNALTNRIPEFIVFVSLLGLIVFYTYYLNDGVIIVDQWFHHGRALLMGSHIYKDLASSESYKDPYTDSGSDITQIYPPIFSSLLAGFFDLSGSASVNAYVSIGFLNAMPVFGFYYFFTRWVPNNKKGATLLATTLFVLSSGFGWIYAVDMAIASPPGSQKQPEISSINIFARVQDTAYDIGLPTSFINVGHPDITTPLIIIALPAGFTMLGMIKEVVVKKVEGEGEGSSIINLNVTKNRTHTTTVSKGRHNFLILKNLTQATIKTSLLITLVSFLGILSHDEFYLFVIIACVAIVVLLARPSAKRLLQNLKGSSRNALVYGYSIVFYSFLVAMCLVALVDTFISPTKYYVSREIVGFSLIFLCFIFVSSTLAIHVAIYVITRRNISSSDDKNFDTGVHKNNIHLKLITGTLRIRRLDYAVSRMKEISGSIKIRYLSSICNYFCNSNEPSRSVYSFGDRIIRLYLPVFTVSVIAFFYLFTFLVWSQLPNEDIRSQADTENEWNVPWYLYPMKFGLTGLLGIVFLLSYLFKKFEKEIFVFAIVAITALLAGPYYDEHRFGKYIMTGMASFAALLIYDMISKPFSLLSFIPLRFRSMHFRTKFKVLSGGILIGLVITFSGLSIFMFAGFVELYSNVADFNQHTRRDFPTHSEMQLLDFLHSRVVAGDPDKYYNVAVPEKEVDNTRGFLTKIYGFTPIPRAKLLQTPLVLNASTLETFYNLLDYSGTRFIILPKNDLSTADISSVSDIYSKDNVIHFALENFRKVYEDDSYVVLYVPTLSPPSPEGDVALIYPKNELSPSSLILGNGNHNRNKTGNTLTILPYDIQSFKQIDNLKEFVKKENESGTAVLYGDKGERIVLWSDPLNLQYLREVNYIEGTFRIIGENKTSNDAGIIWDVGNKEYTVSVRNDRLEILVKSTDVNNTREPIDTRLVNLREIKRENGIWYTLTVIIAGNIINFYVNDLFVAQLPMDGGGVNASMDTNTGNSKATLITNNDTISRVGLFSLDNIAEFKPIKLGKVSLELQKKEETYYRHYYPLNMLALSKIDYNTYIDGDLSAFSNKYVIVPYDPHFIDSNLSPLAGSRYTGEKVDNSVYLDYVKNGGNLIVIDSANYGKYDMKERSQGVFSRLLSISPTGNYAKFDGLSDATSVDTTKSVTNKKNLSDPAEQDQITQEIKRNYGSFVNISGIVEKTLYNSSNTKEDNISVKSYYTTAENNNTNNKTKNTIVAPFIIEKKYGNGKITYVNAHGYFHTIFSGLSSINNNNNNNNTYHSNNKDHYFSTLANITNLIDPNLAREDGQFSNRNFLNAAASTAGSSGATKIRQILDNIQISSGYATRINSSSLLLSISDSSNGDLAAKDVTFTSSSSLSAPFSVTNLSSKNVTTATNHLGYRDMADRPLQSNNESDGDSNYKYSLKNAKIRNLKMYGSYEVIVESNVGSKLLSPVFPSFFDYVAFSLLDGFDMTIKLSDNKPSYAEFEIIEDNDDAAKVNGTFQRLRIYGDDAMDSSGTSRDLGLANIKSNEIHFHKTRSDLASYGYTSLLMKSPQFQVKEEGAGTAGMQRGNAENRPQENVNTILTFKRDSPETEPIEIMNKVGSKESVIFRIDYVDSYNQPYREGIKNHYLTYIEEDIKVIQNDINKDDVENDPSSAYQYSTKTPDIKLPGDISERAKRQGVGVQWHKTMTSDSGLLLAILVTTVAIIATKIATKMNSWSKLKSS